MAITQTPLVGNSSATDASSYATASITPTTGRLVLCSVVNNRAAGSTLPTVTGNGLTWVQVATVQCGSANIYRATIFRAMGTASTGAITIDFGGVTQIDCFWSVSEFAGTDTSGTNGSGAIVQSTTGTSGTGTGTTATCTLASFGDATNNAAYAATRGGAASAIDPDPTATWAEIHDVSIGGEGRLETQWRTGEDLTVTATVPSANWCIAAVEIKMASAAAAYVRPVILVPSQAQRRASWW